MIVAMERDDDEAETVASFACLCGDVLGRSEFGLIMHDEIQRQIRRQRAEATLAAIEHTAEKFGSTAGWGELMRKSFSLCKGAVERYLKKENETNLKEFLEARKHTWLLAEAFKDEYYDSVREFYGACLLFLHDGHVYLEDTQKELTPAFFIRYFELQQCARAMTIATKKDLVSGFEQAACEVFGPQWDAKSACVMGGDVPTRSGLGLLIHDEIQRHIRKQRAEETLLAIKAAYEKNFSNVAVPELFDKAFSLCEGAVERYLKKENDTSFKEFLEAQTHTRLLAQAYKDETYDSVRKFCAACLLFLHDCHVHLKETQLTPRFFTDYFTMREGAMVMTILSKKDLVSRFEQAACEIFGPQWDAKSMASQPAE